MSENIPISLPLPPTNGAFLGLWGAGGSIRDGDPRPWTGSASRGGVLLPSIGRKKNRSVIPGRRTRSRLDRETPGFAGSTKPRDVDENDNRVSERSGPDRIFSRNGRKGPERPETPFTIPRAAKRRDALARSEYFLTKSSADRHPPPRARRRALWAPPPAWRADRPADRRSWAPSPAGGNDSARE